MNDNNIRNQRPAALLWAPNERRATAVGATATGALALGPSLD
jgi:hypothetical protein